MPAREFLFFGIYASAFLLTLSVAILCVIAYDDDDVDVPETSAAPVDH